MPPRVVSLLPAATEIVSALGLGETLVGRSHECDFPSGVEKLPVCTAARLDAGSSAEEIDRGIAELLSRSLSVYLVDAARLRDLAPTHVVTQVACELCAASPADVERALMDWSEGPPALVSLTATDLPGVFRDIERIASALGAPESGKRLAAELRARMDSITRRAQAAGRRPRVATIEWISPLMSAGNWMPEIIERGGGENLFGSGGGHSGRLDARQLRDRNPDVLLVFPCGFALERVRAEAASLEALDGWSEIEAVRRGRVFLGDGNQLFNRPGPRLAETLEAVAEMLHPELFDFGHEGALWERYGGRAGGQVLS